MASNAATARAPKDAEVQTFSLGRPLVRWIVAALEAGEATIELDRRPVKSFERVPRVAVDLVLTLELGPQRAP